MTAHKRSRLAFCSKVKGDLARLYLRGILENDCPIVRREVIRGAQRYHVPARLDLNQLLGVTVKLIVDLHTATPRKMHDEILHRHRTKNGLLFSKKWGQPTLWRGWVSTEGMQRRARPIPPHIRKPAQ